MRILRSKSAILILYYEKEKIYFAHLFSRMNLLLIMVVAALPMVSLRFLHMLRAGIIIPFYTDPEGFKARIF